MTGVNEQQRGLRLMVFDRTCRGSRGRPLGLSHVWWTGSWLYRALDRLDAVFGSSSWHEALDWLEAVEPSRPIAEIQFWGHGKWGQASVRDDLLDRHALQVGHPLRGRLERIRRRMVAAADADQEPGQRPLWWFRTCETFGARAGQDFARAWTDFFGCRAAGHTYIIGYHQSGLHSLLPGEQPRWPADEGLARGSAEAPEQALWSRRSAPNTITCLRGDIPDGY